MHHDIIGFFAGTKAQATVQFAIKGPQGFHRKRRLQ